MPSTAMRALLPSLALAALLPSCTGGFSDGPTGPGRLGAPAGDPSVSGGAPAAIGADASAGAPAAPKCLSRAAGSNPLRHLTREQYVRSVRDLTGVSVDVEALPGDDDSQGFEIGTSMSNLLVEGYADRAAEVADAIDPTALLPCTDAEMGSDGCRDAFVREFGRRAYRRALEAADIASLTALFDAGTIGERGFLGGVRLTVEGVLQSPHFLYHVLDEGAADADGLKPLTRFALANRLSYLVWGSMPDAALLDAAEAGSLASADGVEAELRRMLKANPEAAREGARSFARQWLELRRLEGIGRDEALYPSFTPALVDDLTESLLRGVDDALWGSEPSFEALLTGETAWVNAALADVFGVEPPSSDAADGWQAVALDPAQRAGVLTHPAVLTGLSKPNQSDPVIRGKFVRERLLCQFVQPPPANVATTPPDPAPGATTRQRFAQHTEDIGCQGCHQRLDPVGFGLEHYDALGRYRLTDQDLPVDATGEVLFAGDAEGSFDGAIELAHQLAGSRDVQDCVARQYFRFALARLEETDDACSIQRTADHFDAHAGSFEELLVAVVRSDTFRFASEVLP